MPEYLTKSEPVDTKPYIVYTEDKNIVYSGDPDSDIPGGGGGGILLDSFELEIDSNGTSPTVIGNCSIPAEYINSDGCIVLYATNKNQSEFSADITRVYRGSISILSYTGNDNTQNHAAVNNIICSESSESGLETSPRSAYGISLNSDYAIEDGVATIPISMRYQAAASGNMISTYDCHVLYYPYTYPLFR